MALANPNVQWSVNDDRKYPVGSKTGEVRLNAEFSMYVYKPSWTSPSGRFLLVSLAGTTVTPTQDTMDHDQNDIRGFFTESVDVSIGFVGPQDLYIKQDSPDTTSETGSVTSSISESFNGGFFGEEATGGAGLSISSSVSASLQDFSIVNHSNDNVAHHGYKMTMVREGGRYDVPRDLVDWSAGAWFQGNPLFHVSPRAESNLPIVSQVLYWTPAEITEERLFHISIAHVTRTVEKTWTPNITLCNDWSNVEYLGFDFAIDFGRVK